MRRVLLFVLFGVFVAAPAKADTIAVYDYQGNPFTVCNAGDFAPASCTQFDLSGQITLSAPLAPDTTTDVADTTLESFAFSDGYLADYADSCGGCQSIIRDFSLTTDSAGTIVAWDVSAEGFYSAGDDSFGTVGGAAAADDVSWLAPEGGPGEPGISYYAFANAAAAGTWTDPPPVSAAEPPTEILLFCGIVAVGLLAWLGRVKNA